MRNFIALLRGCVFVLKNSFFCKNIHVGPRLKIYKRLSITGRGRVEIGRDCLIDGIIGDESQYVCINTLSPDAIIKIGDNASLYAARISAKFQVTIGQDVLIEETGIMDTDFHSIDKSRSTPRDENKEKCKITIGDRVCIGARSFITKGVTIGNDAIIAPGSIVTTPVKDCSIVAGNPARIIESISITQNSQHK